MMDSDDAERRASAGLGPRRLSGLSFSFKAPLMRKGSFRETTQSARSLLYRGASTTQRSIRRSSLGAAAFVREKLKRSEPELPEWERPLEERGRRKPVRKSKSDAWARQRENMTSCEDVNPLFLHRSSSMASSVSMSSAGFATRGEHKKQPSFHVARHARLSRHGKSLSAKTVKATRSIAQEEEDDEDFFDMQQEYLTKRDSRASTFL